ncbi:MAG: metastasis-associated protein MTA, partial [Pseudomonadota bacterium]
MNKTTNGNVEAKVMCFFRRRDLPGTLISLADKHHYTLEQEGQLNDKEDLNYQQKHQLKHRELFLSRQLETLPATHIRGKCSVTLLNETESFLSYINCDDMFFYCLVFDPSQRTLLADKGEIRVGSRYQADTTTMLAEGEQDTRNLEELETLVWTPEHNLTDRQIDQFLVTARSIGTFARALDCTSSVKQPSLHMSAAAASRDITLFHAMDTLHKHKYKVSAAVTSLVPPTGPVLCRDEMEEWSASEANLFEEALEKYGKDFNDIRHDFLPWKSLKNIIEYYYMWKTTDRYVQQKRVKAVEAESKLKQVYIPNYTKDHAHTPKAVINGNSDVMLGNRPCESCATNNSSQWYNWGQSQSKLCSVCWNYWKKYGGLKKPSALGEPEMKKKSENLSDDERCIGTMTSHRPHRCSIIGCTKEFKVKAQLVRHYASAHGLAIRQGSPKPVMKTRTAFYLATTLMTRLSRRVCRHILKPRRAARAPFRPVDIQAIKQECQLRMMGRSLHDLKYLIRPKRDRGGVTNIATRLAVARKHELKVPEWLAPTDKNKIPKSERIAFPKPPKAPDGSLMYERIPNKGEPPISMKRKYDDMEGGDLSFHSIPGGAVKKVTKVVGGTRTVINHLNGKIRAAALARSGRKQVIAWMDAPDDVYFKSTEVTKKLRRRLSSVEMRRAARKP